MAQVELRFARRGGWVVVTIVLNVRIDAQETPGSSSVRVIAGVGHGCGGVSSKLKIAEDGECAPRSAGR